MSDDELEGRVRRLRALRPPWGLGLRPDQDLKQSTLVITGGRRPLYEETAASLARLGARHRTFEGAGHRVQDDRRATSILRDWFSEQR